MSSKYETASLLAAMTDAASFERLAAEVLRAAKPELYGALAHPGVQPGGKAVKAPLDNIDWVETANGAHFVGAAHTTTDSKGLKVKWLHDPVTVVARKKGRKSTQPVGDVVKAIAEVNKLRLKTPELKVTLALTASCEPSLETLTDAKSLARSSGIDLDIWSAGRIAQFLDTSPAGQIIRRNRLGSRTELVSMQLLLEAGVQSVKDHLRGSMPVHHIRRDGFVLGAADTLVVGASGMGKTTACANALSARLERGAPALVIRNELLARSSTVGEAVEGELRRQYPELEAGAGSKALALCTADAPLMLLVEDINRSDSPGSLLNKLLSWVGPGDEPQTRRTWRFVCPVWPRHLDSVENQKQVLERLAVVQLGAFSESEGTDAVLQRAKSLDIDVDREQARAIASKLGFDPLLIGLQDLSDLQSASNVIREYVDGRLKNATAGGGRLALMNAVGQLLGGMLQSRMLSPSWDQVATWMDEQRTLDSLEALAREGSVLRVSETAPGLGRIEFRHDRVLYTMLSDAIADEFSRGVLPDYVRDPFFAEIVGAAAGKANLSLERLSEMMEDSPAVAAYALKIASEQGDGYVQIATQALRVWLLNWEMRENRLAANRRYLVATILAETDYEAVPALVELYPRGDFPWMPLFAAQLRNERIAQGLRYFRVNKLGHTNGALSALVAHLKRSRGASIAKELDVLMRGIDMRHVEGRGQLASALIFAGYLGDVSLSKVIRLRWSQESWDSERVNLNLLRIYLFAASRCCDREAEDVIEGICDVWAGIPGDQESQAVQPINALVAHGVSWEFRSRDPHPDAVACLARRASMDDRLAWPITYMFRTVDHPIAVEHIARYLAKSPPATAHALEGDWERSERNGDRKMSVASRSRLFEIACDQAQPDDLRRNAFSFWSISSDERDVAMASSIKAGSPVFKAALWMRARRRDFAVIPEIAKRMESEPNLWLHAALYVWSDELTALLPAILKNIAEGPPEAKAQVAESAGLALRKIDPETAMSLLEPLWEELCVHESIAQVALFSTAKRASVLLSIAVAAADDPGEFLRHCVLFGTMNYAGDPGLASPSQLKNVVQYLDRLPENALVSLWQLCSDRGWLAFRDRYLIEPIRALRTRYVHLPDDPVDVSFLDGELTRRHFFGGDIWFERSLRQGVQRSKLIEASLRWASSHGDPKAMRICADMFAKLATRAEFELFEATFRGRPDMEELRPSLKFDVFRRTLT